MDLENTTSFLKHVLEEAKKKANESGKKSISVELIMIGILEACNGEPDEANASEDFRAELLETRKFLEKHHLDDTFYQRLTEQVQSSSGSISDSLAWQKTLYNVFTIASKKQELATVPLLLNQILANPTPFIRQLWATAGSALQRTESGGSELTGRTGAKEQGEGDDSGKNSGIPEKGSAAEDRTLPKAAFLAELTRKAKRMQKELSESVFGQEHAITTFVSGYFQSQLLKLSDEKRRKPCATFLFAGAPGVGKTYLAEKSAEILNLPFKRFDMSEYADSESSQKFCGLSQVYKGAQPGSVTGFVAKYPECVLLFDEIEKAHIKIIHLFLQMLDAGRLKDNYIEEEVSFRNTIIILTTNAGRQLYEENAGALSGISRKTVIQALKTDINVNTRAPLFPAAICSRFASGNVVMFNHMQAHHLKRIVKTRIEKNAKNLEEKFGIQIQVDEDVSSAVLFAEGGHADARTVTGRAENFLNTELFELFRLVASENSGYQVEQLEKIRFRVNLEGEPEEVRSLFLSGEPEEVLVFGSPELVRTAQSESAGCRIFAAARAEDAMQLLKEKDISAVFLEPAQGPGEKEYLNIEDITSPYIQFYQELRESIPSMPVYILQTERAALSEEEWISFARTGARGRYQVKDGVLSEAVHEVCEVIHQQKSMNELARYNKVVNYNSAQKILDGGRTAEIYLAHFELKYAVDAEDSGKILADVSKPDVKFEDIIGAEDAKEELRFFADYLRYPRRYLKKGLRSPRGILLYGPPGTGKTLLAKAMAAEAGMTFLTAEGGQFLKKYVGEGPQAVHDLFRTARKYAPAILFIDEIDAIGRQRTGENAGRGGDEILNALLTEMDGFRNETPEQVFVLAATNFEVTGQGANSLDGALIRRFDRKICVELPNRQERRCFLERKIRKNPALVISESKIDNLAERTTGMSLALLDSVVELSLRNAMRQQADSVNDEMLEEALETYNGGREKKWDPALLLRTARHEAGHALVCWGSGETPSYLTIVARADHGGYMQHADAEDKGVYTRRELLGRIRTALGGRAAELVYYGPEEGVTTGASGDLQTATNLARYMICSCGMDEELGMATRERSASTQEESAELRKKINEILAVELEHAREEILAHRAALDRLVEVLLEKNHIDGKEMKEIFENT